MFILFENLEFEIVSDFEIRASKLPQKRLDKLSWYA